METSAFKMLARIRNGAETVMSVLRRVYRVDTMPVRGLLRGRMFFGCKIAAQRADIALAMESRSELRLWRNEASSGIAVSRSAARLSSEPTVFAA